MHQPAPVPTPRDQRLERLRRERLPVAVWALAIAASASLLALRATQIEAVGVAETPGPAVVSSEGPGAAIAEVRAELTPASLDAAFDERLHAAMPVMQVEPIPAGLPAEEEAGQRATSRRRTGRRLGAVAPPRSRRR